MKKREIKIEDNEITIISILLTDLIIRENNLKNKILSSQNLKLDKLSRRYLENHLTERILKKDFYNMHLMKKNKRIINLNKAIVGEYSNIQSMLYDIIKYRSLTNKDYKELINNSNNGSELLLVYKYYKMSHLRNEGDSVIGILEDSARKSYLELLVAKERVEKQIELKYGIEMQEFFIRQINEEKDKNQMYFILSGNATIEEYECFSSKYENKEIKQKLEDKIPEVKKDFIRIYNMRIVNI